MTLEERIDIMEASGVISPATKDKVQQLRRLFGERYGIQLTEQNAAACITHFAMALERLAKGETVEPASDLIMEELRRHSDYDTASYLTAQIFEEVTPLPEQERQYILLHVITVLTKIRAEYDREMGAAHPD